MYCVIKRLCNVQHRVTCRASMFLTIVMTTSGQVFCFSKKRSAALNVDCGLTSRRGIRNHRSIVIILIIK